MTLYYFDMNNLSDGIKSIFVTNTLDGEYIVRKYYAYPSFQICLRDYQKAIGSGMYNI